MSEAYSKVAELNIRATTLIAAIQQTGDPNDLAELHTLMLPITSQEASKVIRKLCLSRTDVFDDLLQEAYMKLRDVIKWYDPDRCPVFISFWRTAVYRHLLSMYHSSKRARALGEDEDVAIDGYEDQTAAILDIQSLHTSYIREVETWPQTHVRYATMVPMLLAVLQYRVFVRPDEKVEQPVLANSYSVTPGYVAKWERYFIDRIREEHQEQC